MGKIATRLDIWEISQTKINLRHAQIFLLASQIFYSFIMDHNTQLIRERKEEERLNATIAKFDKLISKYSQLLIIECTNTSSFQLQKIRKMLRGEAEILRGKVVSSVNCPDPQ
jgi:glutamate racemase